jgi:hypothetical protein
MNNHILNNLRSLSKKRGDTSAFANYDEFLLWSDDVFPLLEFDDALCKRFKFWSDHVKSAYKMGRDTHRDALGECIGVVNQAIKKLEIPTADIESNKPQSKEIEYPDKVTLNWLYRHVPWSFWVALIGLLITSFTFGVAISETGFYKTLKSDSTTQNSEFKKT